MVRIKRSYPEPDVLKDEREKDNGDYRKAEILEKLRGDFFDKCYICESKELTSINVEHLASHRGDKTLKFSWDNLFWSCSHCNNIKLENFDNILDCTKEDVEKFVWLRMDMFPKASIQLRALGNSPKINKTIELLDKVYNGSTIIKKMESENIRKQILHELSTLSNYMLEYFDETEKDVKEVFKKKIKKCLSTSSAFAAFKRWIVRDNPELLMEFAEYIA